MVSGCHRQARSRACAYLNLLHGLRVLVLSLLAEVPLLEVLRHRTHSAIPHGVELLDLLLAHGDIYRQAILLGVHLLCGHDLLPLLLLLKHALLLESK